MVRRIVLIPVVAAALSSGCADDGTSLRVECPVRPQREDDACIYSASGEECVVSGTLNFAVARQYELFLRVSSGLVARNSTIPLRPEVNNLDVTGAEVTILSTGGEAFDFGDLPNPFSVTSNGRIPVGGAGIASVLAIPPDYEQAMEDAGFEQSEGTIVLRVQLEGRTDGDVPVTSRNWRWPVSLLDVPASQSNCVPADDERIQCQPGQDFEVFPFCSNLPP